MIKKSGFIIILCLFFVSFSTNCIGATVESQIRKRYALVVGANYGGPERTRLCYAVSDAKSIASVLKEIGGTSNEDITILSQPSKGALLEELYKIQQKITSNDTQNLYTEFIFYYSGHSDHENIFLGSDKLSYSLLKQVISNFNVDLRIVILDSCSSGAFTLLKGGKKLPSILTESPNELNGYAFLTSSATDEYSQESDLIKGSFFTYFLVSGLRGAADLNADGQITLNEAYQFAFNETLAITEKTLAGPQHPSYDIQIKGTGEVVLTDIRNSNAILKIDQSIYGRIFIRDQIQLLKAELNKTAGLPVLLSLEPGRYNITLRCDDALFTAKVNLTTNGQIDLTPTLFTKSKAILTLNRGNNIYGNEAVYHLNYCLNETGFSNIGLKTGNLNYYTIYIAGLNNFNWSTSQNYFLSNNENLLQFGFGPGLHFFLIPPWSVDFQGIISNIYGPLCYTDNHLLQLRTEWAYSIGERFALTAGCTYNFFMSFDSGDTNFTWDDNHLQKWLGLFCGIQWRLK